MLYVGLTGGIGSGKSTVAGRFAEHGAYVIDSDRIAREVVEPGTDGLIELVAAFGHGILAEDGTLNRPALAAVAFADDDSRKQLNSIVHPKVGMRTMELVGHAPADAVVIHDIPLLVEIGAAPNYQLVIIVDAPVDVRVHRLVHSRGLSEQDARARIAAQATEEARRAVADVWLDNSGSPDQVLEANIRLHRPAPRGTTRVIDPDPTWQAQAHRVIARLRQAVGHHATEIAHVGPTSVPGQAAADVIDIEITVATDEDAAALAEPLAKVGFFPWQNDSYAGADPMRRVDVQVRTS
jgi:dephospho-CoA kinase